MTPSARRLIARAREAYSPSLDELDRLRSRLRSAPPSATPPDEDDPPTDVGTAGASSSAANWGLYLLLAVVVGVVAWTIGGGEPRSNRIEPVRRTIPSMRVVPIERPAMLEPLKIAAAPDEPAPAPKPSGGRVREPSAPAEIDDGFARQVAIIGEARRALTRGWWTEVRTLTSLYARDYPNGSFGEEAEVLDLLARCSSDRDERALAQATAYLETPGRVFTERVRKACFPDVESPSAPSKRAPEQP